VGAGDRSSDRKSESVARVGARDRPVRPHVIPRDRSRPLYYPECESSGSYHMVLTKRVIPCIDVDLDDDGNPAVYTGVNFEDLKYTGDPVEMARAYNRAGADEFVFLDITASAEGRETMLDVVERVADEVFIPSQLAAASEPPRISRRRSGPARTRFRSPPARSSGPNSSTRARRRSATSVSLSASTPNGGSTRKANITSRSTASPAGSNVRRRAAARGPESTSSSGLQRPNRGARANCLSIRSTRTGRKTAMTSL